MRIVVIGGGWAGCAAALTARAQGAGVILLERADMLLGTGLVGGIFRNNGRFTAAEEMIALGGGELFELMDAHSLHRNLAFPGHAHASLYSVATMEPAVRRRLKDRGVETRLTTRVVEVERVGDRVAAVRAKVDGAEAARFEADVFVEATGTAGPPANCNKHGNGCAMCVLRCHSFGGRVSVAAKAGIKELDSRKGDRTGAMSGSCKLLMESLAPAIHTELQRKGVVVIPLPEERRLKAKLSMKACQQYALEDFERNVILLHTGHAKLMTPFFPLDDLRSIPGLENARYEDPYAGGLGNSIRYIGMSARDDTLRVAGLENLFCAGEKAGLMVGHTEAVCTGALAGHNAARLAGGKPPLTLPDSLAVGDMIAFVGRQMENETGRSLKYTFSGSVYFDRMKQLDLYTADPLKAARRVEALGLSGVFAAK